MSVLTPPITLANLRDVVRDLVGDKIRKDGGGTVLAGPTTWTDDEISDSLNFAQVAYFQKTGIGLKYASVSGSGGLFSLGNTNVGNIIDVGGLLKSNIGFEARLSPTWLSDTGAGKRWVPISPTTFRVVPSDSSARQVCYLDAPAFMTGDSDTPDTRIPYPHHVHLPYAAAARLLTTKGDKQNEGKAAGFMTMFQNLVQTLHQSA